MHGQQNIKFVVISYRRFGTPYRSHLQLSRFKSQNS